MKLPRDRFPLRAVDPQNTCSGTPFHRRSSGVWLFWGGCWGGWGGFVFRGGGVLVSLFFCLWWGFGFFVFGGGCALCWGFFFFLFCVFFLFFVGGGWGGFLFCFFGFFFFGVWGVFGGWGWGRGPRVSLPIPSSRPSPGTNDGSHILFLLPFAQARNSPPHLCNAKCTPPSPPILAAIKRR